MNALQIEYILKQVELFRSLVGLGTNSEAMHEQLFASEALELYTATSHAEEADAFADMVVILAGHVLHGNFEDNNSFVTVVDGIEQQAEINEIDLLEAFNIVMTSNMSKVCRAEDQEATNQKYRKEGVLLEWVKRPHGYYACYSAADYHDKPKGKLLKPVTYVEPDWSGDDWKLDRITQWNNASLLPPVDTALRIKLTDNIIVDGVRTSYVKGRKKDLGYYMKAIDDLFPLPSEHIVGWCYE